MVSRFKCSGGVVFCPPLSKNCFRACPSGRPRRAIDTVTQLHVFLPNLGTYLTRTVDARNTTTVGFQVFTSWTRVFVYTSILVIY